MNFIDQFKKLNIPNFGYTRLPKPPITKQDREKYNSNEKDSNSEFLKKICYNGFEQRLKDGRINKKKYKEYVNRITLELKTFDELFFTDYILMVWTVINKAKELGIFMDFGRGSVSSSLVATLIGICDCDAVKYGLFFSRFLSKARAESKLVNNERWISIELAPDVDINLGGKRDEIVDWLKEIYPGGISKVANVNTLTGKILIKDVYKTLEEATEEQSKEISDLVERRFGVVQDLSDVYQESKEFKSWADEHKETYEIALKLQYLPFAVSCHASGYLVSFDSLENHTPSILNKEKELMSIYTMGDVQCLKLDLLNLDTNRIIKNILDNINIDLSKINLEDGKIIYETLQNDSFLPYGIYQLSGDCAYRVCKSIKPKNVVELSHVNAIARPVGLMYEKPYLENTEDCPEIFKSSLAFSHYQPLYQENLIAMVKAIGFTEEESEQFRRAFAKKKPEEVKKWMVKINERLKQNNIKKETGEYLLKIAKESASYQFNFSHSLSTSLLSALTVYLKYNYPLEFYCACLNEVKEKQNPIEEISLIEQELKYFNIKLLGPHILKSKENFTIEDGNIRFSLNSIKGVSDKTLVKLRNFCHPYSDKFEIFSAAENAGLNIAVLNNLIYAGCLDDYLTQSRTKTALESSLYSLLTPREKIRVGELGKEMNYDLIKIIQYLSKPQNGAEKPFIKEGRLETLREKFAPHKKVFDLNSKNEELTHYIVEKALLGYSYSQNIFDILKKEYNDIQRVCEIIGALEGENFTFGGELTNYKEGKSKNGNKYIKCSVSDGSALIDVLLMEKGRYKGKETDQFEFNNELNNNVKLEDGNIVMVKGRKGKDNIIFANKIVLQDIKISTKIIKEKEKKND